MKIQPQKTVVSLLLTFILIASPGWADEGITDGASSLRRIDDIENIKGMLDSISTGNRTMSLICVHGDCYVQEKYNAGYSSPTCDVADAQGKGGYLSLASYGGSQTRATFEALVDMRGLAMLSPESCQPNGTCATAVAFGEACSGASRCNQQCHTSALINSDFGKGCSQNPKGDEACMQSCSPVKDLTKQEREQVLLSKYKRAVEDLKNSQQAQSQSTVKGLAMDDLPYFMTCLNTQRENTNIEPMDVNYEANSGKCDGFTAVGIGQIIKDTFFGTLGLTGKGAGKACAETKISDISSCAGFSQSHYNEALYAPYKDLTVKQLFEGRTFLIDLGARSSLATMLNHMKGVRSFDEGMNGYFGKEDPAAMKKIRSCAERLKGSSGRISI